MTLFGVAVLVVAGRAATTAPASLASRADTLTLDMDGLDPDHVVGFALNPRLKPDLGELRF